MKARVGWSVLAAAAALGNAPASAEWSTEFSAEAAFVAGVMDADRGAGSVEPTWHGSRISLLGEASWLFDGGLEVGFAAGGSLLRDNPRRHGLGARLGACPPDVAGCPAVTGASPVGPVSHLRAAGAAVDEQLYGRISTAAVVLRHPWGEASLGVDEGAASRFGLEPPSVLSLHTAAQTPVDLAGIGGPVLRNDLARDGLRATYASPRLLGLRLGVSFAPEEGGDAGDVRAPLRRAAAENVGEAGLSYVRNHAGGSIALAATWSAAELTGAAGFSDITVVGLGAQVEQGRWRLGGAALRSDNGRGADSEAYEAAGAGLVYDAGAWKAGAEVGAWREGLLDLEGASGVLAASRRLSDRVEAGAGLVFRSYEANTLGSVTPKQQHKTSYGAVFEIILRP